MKKTVTAGETPTTWAPEALYNKAQRYIQHASAHNTDEWEYALWSSLSLEFLARAALANVSPALLAETDKGWSSLYHSLGFTPTEEKYAPKSVNITEVFRRLTSILTTFTKEYETFGIVHTGRRNSELHTGEAAFDGIKVSVWQPRFYQVCDVLLASCGMNLEDFFGAAEAKIAVQVIAAAVDEGAKAVKGEVDAHRKVWQSKEEMERDKLAAQAAIWATKQYGHRVQCPACTSTALVFGEPVSAPQQKLHDGEITETQEYLPNQFECIACGLKVAGLSRLSVIGLGDRYKKTSTYDAAEFYAPEDTYYGYEEDNNEP